MDVLDEVKIGVAYKLNGKPIESIPGKSFLIFHTLCEYFLLPWNAHTTQGGAE